MRALKLSFNHYFSVSLMLVLLSLVLSFTAKANSFVIPLLSDGSLGKYTQYFQEPYSKLTLSQARDHFMLSSTNNGTSQSISLGIDAAPVWMKFTVNNTSELPQKYRLAVETPWLDYIDTWLVHNGEVMQHIQGGDALPFEQRPMPYRFYTFEHDFLSGKTDVFIRIETKGPMAMPVKLSSIEQANKNDISNAYQYGVLYGIMLALALYNLVLYFSIRQKEYGLYSLYLIGFVLNSLSYTGQLHTFITYDLGAYFQDWLNIFLMVTYSVAGLNFARVLLMTKDYARSLDKFVLRTTLFIPIAILFCFIFNQLLLALSLSFLLNTSFVIFFVVIGGRALIAQIPFARIFLLSSITAAICITVTTLAVAGILVPYNQYTFKAIEVGMAFEAILLAVILARQFRMAQLDKLIAENYARTDTLTQLNNRRGFQYLTKPLWQAIIRQKRAAAFVLIDIDLFKKFNDLYGHDTGDKVLYEVAQSILSACRASDILARWGGEEFIVFLPETSQAEALAQAERIRLAIEALNVRINQVTLSITASIGVAGTCGNTYNNERLTIDSLEMMINEADRALYIAKQKGKNQVYANDYRKVAD